MNRVPVFLTVIVPVYNAERYLRRCLDSLLQLGSNGVELVLVNDGSTDASSSILTEYKERCPHVVVISQENGGYGKAMNIGLAAAHGLYVGIVEPDDRIAPDAYAALLGLARETGAHVIKGDYGIVRHGLVKPVHKTERFEEGRILSPSQCPDYLQGHPSIWSAIYNRSWLQENQIRFHESPGASFQDLGFAVKTWASAKSIVFSHGTVYYYTEDNPCSSIHQKDSAAWKALAEVLYLRPYVENLPAEAKAVRSVLARRFFLTARTGFLRQVSKDGLRLLREYSVFFNACLAPETLDAGCFSKNEWKDLLLLCNEPECFESQCRSGTNVWQKIFSLRRECSRRVLRLAGFRFPLS